LTNGLNNTKNKAMEKTLRQWFEMFPEPYRTQAIENTIELEGKARLEMTDKNAVEAINGGFVWKKSSQGHDYWSEFAIKIYRNEITLIERAERMYSKQQTLEEFIFKVPFDYNIKPKEVIDMCMKEQENIILTWRLGYFIDMINSLPDDTEKNRILKSVFDNRDGELLLESYKSMKSHYE
jgi:hypothetical protein